MRTIANADRAETGHLPGLLRSVLNRPSQEAGRELASGERFWPVSAPGQSMGLPRKPRDPCASRRECRKWRARRPRELAEGVRLGPNRVRLWLGKQRVRITARGAQRRLWEAPSHAKFAEHRENSTFVAASIVARSVQVEHHTTTLLTDGDAVLHILVSSLRDAQR